RALMARPRLLLLDEPSMGLARMLIKQIFTIIEEINEQGTTVLLVEQNAAQALKLAHYAYLLETGEIVRSGTGAELANDPSVRAAYLGGDVLPVATARAGGAHRSRAGPCGSAAQPPREGEGDQEPRDQHDADAPHQRERPRGADLGAGEQPAD